MILELNNITLVNSVSSILWVDISNVIISSYLRYDGLVFSNSHLLYYDLELTNSYLLYYE